MLVLEKAWMLGLRPPWRREKPASGDALPAPGQTPGRAYPCRDEVGEKPDVGSRSDQAASAIVDRSHATVVRCISRTSFGSNGRARCIVARLSHITRSHCFHSWA